MSLKFVTGNQNKFQEVKSFIPKIEQLEYDFGELQSLNIEEIITDKLEKAVEHSNGDSLIIDDTSFILDKIGLPGTLIKFFLQKLGSEGIYKFAKEFDALEATVINKIGFFNNNDSTIKFFEGVVHGIITSPKGESFGFDSIFIPNGYKETFAENLEMKSKISHRATSIRSLLKHLDEINFIY